MTDPTPAPSYRAEVARHRAETFRLAELLAFARQFEVCVADRATGALLDPLRRDDGHDDVDVTTARDLALEAAYRAIRRIADRS